VQQGVRDDAATRARDERLWPQDPCEDTSRPTVATHASTEEGVEHCRRHLLVLDIPAVAREGSTREREAVSVTHRRPLAAVYGTADDGSKAR
jgi:hypothetical protein